MILAKGILITRPATLFFFSDPTVSSHCCSHLRYGTTFYFEDRSEHFQWSEDVYLDRLQVFHGTCGRQTTFLDAIVILATYLILRT